MAARERIPRRVVLRQARPTKRRRKRPPERRPRRRVPRRAQRHKRRAAARVQRRRVKRRAAVRVPLLRRAKARLARAPPSRPRRVPEPSESGTSDAASDTSSAASSGGDSSSGGSESSAAPCVNRVVSFGANGSAGDSDAAQSRIEVDLGSDLPTRAIRVARSSFGRSSRPLSGSGRRTRFTTSVMAP